jgi:peptide/nickel transport system permease protein
MGPIIILFSIRVPGVIMLEASLSFLGFGIPPPTPSWGAMLGGQGRDYMFLAPWMALWPGVALAVVVYGVNMLGDAIRDILDPRLQGGSGRYGSKAGKNAARGGWQSNGAAKDQVAKPESLPEDRERKTRRPEV